MEEAEREDQQQVVKADVNLRRRGLSLGAVRVVAWREGGVKWLDVAVGLADALLLKFDMSSPGSM